MTGLHNKLISGEISFGFNPDQVRPSQTKFHPGADIYVLAESFILINQTDSGLIVASCKTIDHNDPPGVNCITLTVQN